MKKFTLIAALACVAASASAQYNVEDPSIDAVLEGGKVATVQYIALDDASLTALEQQGATCTLFGPNGAGDGNSQNLWIWDNTFVAGEPTYPGVGMHFDGYVSLVVSNIGWSGAGYNIATTGVSTMDWNDETHFHLGYMSPGTVCPSVALIIGDQDGANTPARVALGAAYNDNGTQYPSIGYTSKDDWQAIDIKFSDLKKIYPGFNYANTNAWLGNIMSFLCGGTQGQTIAFDAVYFYNYVSDGVSDIEIDENAPATYYNLQGVEMQGELTPGLYIKRQGATATKVVIK